MKKKNLLFACLISLIAILSISIKISNTSDSNYDLSLSTIKVALADDEGSGGLLWQDYYYSVSCSATFWEQTLYYNENGKLVGRLFIQGGNVVVRYTGSYSYTYYSCGTIGPRILQGRQCPDGWDPFCTVCSNPCNGSC